MTHVQHLVSVRRPAASAVLAAIALALLALPSQAADRNLGNLGKVQVQALCAGTGGHDYRTPGAAYGCEGPGSAWLIRCDTDGACIIESGIGRIGASPVNGGALFGSLGGGAPGGGNGSLPGGGPTTGGPTTGGGSVGCICNQIGGGPTPTSSPISVTTVPTAPTGGLKQLGH